ncbi:SMI1/KNR4 family protein [Burkholderia cenocepacia]|uniref:SMI1/KNR4 family protein n=1 Tax=Burkholderia cenocepacia TaxID=95486 RepID=UPI003D15F624
MQDRVLKSWYRVGGASEAAIASLRRAAGFDLPAEYVEFLRFSNGGEGPLCDPSLGLKHRGMPVGPWIAEPGRECISIEDSEPVRIFVGEAVEQQVIHAPA